MVIMLEDAEQVPVSLLKHLRISAPYLSPCWILYSTVMFSFCITDVRIFTDRAFYIDI
ncbi:hypothetical protein L873DRAFT_1799624 [Choiromyces venosus 120613-1]|uniref:Uncharacterized protein n=1 Tax=Choiromyces venosus 120613-1 TaxID=1336337 RepID=A0A3N4K1J0_9PEZI|nr:hypothetical protein L873DRAFT_1799624 [Choiromyces venosus 120613-1]